MAKTIHTNCSDCMTDLVIDGDKVTAQIPSSGSRGSKFVPAHEATSEVTGDDDLLMWDCPACGHADSYDLTLDD